MGALLLAVIIVWFFTSGSVLYVAALVAVCWIAHRTLEHRERVAVEARYRRSVAVEAPRRRRVTPENAGEADLDTLRQLAELRRMME